MSRFNLIPTPLAGLMVIQRTVIEDYRGFLSRFYCADEFREAGLDNRIAQINHTLTRKKGAVRGLHFQHSPHGETKLVSCIKGEIFDIAVDIRKGSATFLRWHGEILSAENHKSLFIPEGFAHGFQTLTDDCELIYLHSVAYHRESEGALNVTDPMISIAWPLNISDISERDRAHPVIDTHFEGLAL